MSNIRVFSVDQILISKILCEIFEAHECSKKGINKIVYNCLLNNLFKLDDSFINFAYSICPYTYRGCLEYQYAKLIQTTINAGDYTKFVSFVGIVLSNKMSTFYPEGGGLKSLELIPNDKRSFEHRILPLRNELCKGGIFPPAKTIPLKNFSRCYPMPSRIIFNDIPYSMKDLCRTILGSKNNPMFKEAGIVLQLELEITKRYYNLP